MTFPKPTLKSSDASTKHSRLPVRTGSTNKPILKSPSSTAPNGRSANRADHCIFRFFDLPRELRDDIYDLCLEHWKSDHMRTDIYAFNVARMECLLICRRFAREYLSREKKLAALHIIHACSPAPLHEVLPLSLRRIEDITIYMDLPTFINVRQIIVSDMWKLTGKATPNVHRDVALFPTKRKLAIVLVVFETRWHVPTHAMQSILQKHRWVDITDLTSLDVYYRSRSQPEEGLQMGLS